MMHGPKNVYFTVNVCPLFQLRVAVSFSTNLAIYELWIYASTRFIKLNLDLILRILLDMFRH